MLSCLKKQHSIPLKIHGYDDEITNLHIALSQDDASNNSIRLEQQIKSCREKIDEINNQLNKLLRTVKYFASDLISCMENIENSAINNFELKSEINQLKIVFFLLIMEMKQKLKLIQFMQQKVVVMMQ